jgi:hypothetical protein
MSKFLDRKAKKFLRDRMLFYIKALDSSPVEFFLANNGYNKIIKKNQVNDEPKVVVKGDYLFFYCPFCKSIHSVKICNNISDYFYDPRPETNDDYWLWNERLDKPTLNHCIHMSEASAGYDDCALCIKDGYISLMSFKGYRDYISTGNISPYYKEVFSDLLKKSYNLPLNKEELVSTMLNAFIPMLPVKDWPVKI